MTPTGRGPNSPAGPSSAAAGSAGSGGARRPAARRGATIPNAPAQTPGSSSESSESSVAPTLPVPEGFRIAQRVVLPRERDLDTLPLYLDLPAKAKARSLHSDDLIDRTRINVRAGERVSFGSYFNAFPASYWRRWTVVEAVRLQIRTIGPGTLVVYRSNSRGAAQRVDHVELSGEMTSEFDLPLNTFGDGGWYWFDVVASAKGVVLDGAQWLVADHGRPRGRVSMGITTMNKTDYCLRTIGMVAADARLREILDEMLIVDQGSQKVTDEPGYPELAEAMGSQLRIIEQANLGGSGGFSRGMYEAATRGSSDYVLLLDDDIILETESIGRLVAFADLCRTPTIVGGHMFDLNNRTVLHTFGEIINPFYWQPGLPAPDHRLGHDFVKTGLQAASWLHQRVDVDYNGWWMCLIPVQVVRRLGLALPVFIKWDDTEYGLRAKAAGVPTVSLPGSAVWHVSWIDKDDLVGWQAYFHARNRLITALMYSPFERGASLVRTAFQLDLKHLVSMQYATEAGRLLALRDVLAGPDHLHEILPTRLGDIRELSKDYPDAQMLTDIDTFPEVRAPKPLRPDKSIKRDSRGRPLPPSTSTLARKGLTAIARQVLAPMDERALQHPQARIAHKDNKWWRVARHDSALVSTADGVGASWYQRDPAKMRTMAAQSGAAHAQILREWKQLRHSYLDARDRITSFEAWERTFGISPAPDRTGQE